MPDLRGFLPLFMKRELVVPTWILTPFYFHLQGILHTLYSPVTPFCFHFCNTTRMQLSLYRNAIAVTSWKAEMGRDGIKSCTHYWVTLPEQWFLLVSYSSWPCLNPLGRPWLQLLLVPVKRQVSQRHYDKGYLKEFFIRQMMKGHHSQSDRVLSLRIRRSGE